MKGFQNGDDVVIFEQPHQDPGNSVLDVLKFLPALARDPIEECIAVIQPGADKDMDKLLFIGQRECWMEFSNVPEMVERGFTGVFDVVSKGS